MVPSHRSLLLAALFATGLGLGCGSTSSGAGDEDAGLVDASDDAATLPSDCEEGELRCWADRLAVCMPGGNAWVVESCAEGELCVEDACVVVECEPGERICDGDAVVACGDDFRWGDAQVCEEGTSCFDGGCVPQTCEPGTRMCGTDRVVECLDDGVTWETTLCDEGWVCFMEACVECVRDDGCGDDEACVDGLCAPLPLGIVTDTIDDGMIDTPYEAVFEAVGGVTPYTWSLGEGDVPAGLTLSDDGVLAGTPTEAGQFVFDVVVSDTDLAEDQLAMELEIHDRGLAITTDSLPVAEEGFAYAATLEALGGEPPYAWGISEGALPAGIQLSSTGELSGAPTEIGDFELTVRVFDNTTPPDWDAQDLTLTVSIAPLEIVGENQLDLFITTVITLPTYTLIDGVPIPYNTQLQARGGLRPYVWTEQELPSSLSFIIPQSGIPDGLELAEDGTLSGSVTDASQVVSITVPVVNITLTGFFFMAEVADSQDSPDTASGLFLLPTVPIGG